MQPIDGKAWRAGRFWWDWPRPSDANMVPLRAVVVDLDALADIDLAGHLPAFNAAFAELGLDITWSVQRYRQLRVLSDERTRVAAELRKRGVRCECDVLAELLVDEICATKAMILAETILDADVAPRPDIAELITEALGAGVAVAVVSTGSHTWVEPLVRQLIGDGVVSAVVTADDAQDGDLYQHALAELGVTPNDSLVFAGSPASQRAATAAGVPTVLVADDDGRAPLHLADCQQVRDTWNQSHSITAA
ncbi:HAD family hydrolase [Mycobacterium sp. pV006]|uniref:HAD family hydrolase n=1 Tax=Mycobacterium sp. pV006 TaxID=3238983 RepID=UPI00351B7EBF